MSTNNTCFYKEVDKSTLPVILKTTKLIDCALIGACVVIKPNRVFGYNSGIFFLISL